MRRNSFQMDFGHFVSGLFPPGDALRGMVGVARVAGGIVESHFHVNAGALREENRRLIPVLLLPIEVPILDFDERERTAARERCPDFDSPAQQVAVRDDAEHFDFLRDNHKARNFLILLAWRNINIHRAERKVKGHVLWGMLGKIEADGDLLVPSLMRGVKMNLHDDVGVLLEKPRDARWLAVREDPWGPEPEVAWGGKPKAAETGIGGCSLREPSGGAELIFNDDR